MWDLQRIVYAIEVGGLRKFLLGGVVLAVMLGLAAYYSVTQFNGLNSAEAMDQAQLGRNLAEGRGFKTWFIRPLAIWQLRERGVADKEINLTQFPDTVNPPAYPMLLGFIFKIAHPQFVVPVESLANFQSYAPERLILLTGIGCTLMAGALLFFWVVRMFDTMAAVIAVVLFLLTDLVWMFTISGLSVSWSIMLVSALGLVVGEALRAEENEGHWLAVLWMAIGGVMMGLMILTHYTYLWALLPFIPFIILSFKKRWIILPVFFGVVMLMTGWWWFRNFQVTGNPFGLTGMSILTNSGKFPGSSLWRSLSMESDVFGVRPYARSLVAGASGQLVTLSYLCGGFLVLSLAVGSVFHSFRSFAAARSRWLWLGIIVLVFLAAAPSFSFDNPDTWNETNQIAPFLPVFLCFGSAFVLVMLDRLHFPLRLIKYLLVIAICVVQAIPLMLKFAGTTPKFPYPPYFPPVLIATSNYLNADEVQMSDLPWASAWYQGRSTIWLPNKREDFFTINDLIHPVCILLLTPYSSDAKYNSQIKAGEYEDWAGLVTRTDFSKSPLPVTMPLWPPDKWFYIMFADKERSRL